jgi:hypothetical protein
MIVALAIYTILVFALFGFLGFIWKASSPLNTSIKLLCIFIAFASVAMLVRGIPVIPFIAFTGFLSLAASVMWDNDSGVNLFIKGFSAVIAVFGGMLLLLS